MKALGRRSASTDQSALTHRRLGLEDPSVLASPSHTPAALLRFADQPFPFLLSLRSELQPHPPPPSFLVCGELGHWAAGWAAGSRTRRRGAWARLQRAERRAPPALVAVTQSSLPLQPPVAAQSFQQEARSISQLSQGHGRGSLLPLAPGAQAAEAQGPWSPGVALHGSRWLHAQPGAALLTLGTSTSQIF